MASVKFLEAIRATKDAVFTHSQDYDLEKVTDDIKAMRAYCQVLHVDNCFQVRSVTPSIGDMSMLRWLNLSYNALTELPPTIGRLRNLERLHVNNNALEALPIEVWALKGLEELRIDNNRLRSFPTGVLFLPKLRDFFPENNCLVGPADVEGAEIESLFPPPVAGDCSNCNGRFLRGERITFVTFHDLCGSKEVPLTHIVCGDNCERQLRQRLATVV